MTIATPAENELAIELHSVRKVYPSHARTGITALDRLDLSVRRGEIYGLVGPNGAGKSTLLRIVATLEEPTFGLVRVAGFDSQNQRAEVCARLGFMPELFALYEELTVREYLEFFALSHRVNAGERAHTIDSVIELTDLGQRADSYAAELSKGMRQRLLLAKTLIHDPEVLLLDEPTSGMDPQARIEFRNILKMLRKMGKTIVLSSHILSDLSQVCTSFGILERGRLRITGSLEEVTRQVGLRAELRIELLSGESEARQIIESDPLVAEIQRIEHGFSCRFAGEAAGRAQLLARLVQAGVQVVSFAERRSDLEDVFVELGATKTQ